MTSTPIFLTVLPVPPSVVAQPASQGVIVGSTVTFSVVADGTPPLSYQWTFGGTNLVVGPKYSGVTTAMLTVNNVQFSDSGNYAVNITNQAGMTNSLTAVLNVVNPPPPSYIHYTKEGLVYAQNFNSLPTPASNTVNTANPVVINGVTYSLGNPFDFAFPSLAAGGIGGFGLTNTMSGWYGAAVVAMKSGASAGDQSTGGIISFGPTNSPSASANRALGLLATSSTGPTTFGAKFINLTPNTLKYMTMHYTGELWRQQPTAKYLSFSYYIDPTATNGLATNLVVTASLTNLDVHFPTGTFTPRDGTQATNQLSLGVTNLAIADWAPGAAFWLIWQMTNAAGTSQGMAIDDLTFSASSQPAIGPVSLSISRASAGSVVISWPEADAGFTLEGNADLKVPNGWGPVGPIVIMNGFNTFTVPVSSGKQFFRLRQ